VTIASASSGIIGVPNGVRPCSKSEERIAAILGRNHFAELRTALEVLNTELSQKRTEAS
jgi:hypothetical protein